jgi:hypothetical protein
MNDQIDLRGVSGAVYRFRLDNPAWPENVAGGIFVYVRQAQQGSQVVYAGHTDCLARANRERWQEAVADHGATHLYTRLHVSRSARTQELDDLIAALKPVMNEDPAAGAPTAKGPRAMAIA